MSRKIQFIFLLILVGLFLTATQSGFAQTTNGPLNFGNNYFVTGDYVVGGAQGMTVNIANGYSAGTITIPDANPGITGAKAIPPGAEVVAALLYWQTIEKSSTVPGQAGSGENGYFMPIEAGGPNAPGYPITGVNLASADTVAYSSSGCTSTSTGEVVRTYRANVLAALPRDSTGNISANGAYEVYLPSVRNSTPLTLGATLVLIYRILSPTVPLNSIVIYDGAYAPTTSSLTMKQTMQGFYDAASSPVARITQIVGQGKPSKVETVYLNNTTLPSLYGIEPAFPGYYGSWDNPTWTFNPTESYVRVPNPILAGAASATTDVVAKSSSEGCVSWGAVIVSTTVANSDGDGLLDAWKVKPAGYANPGYCDASVNEGVCTPGTSASWVDLPGAVHGEKDVFIQLDYMCSSPTGGDSCTTGDGTNYSFDPRLSGAVGLVTTAFAPASTSVHPAIHLHINPSGTNQPDLHAIPEQPCVDNLTASPEELCAFPGQPGVVAWKAGFDVVKNQLVDPSVSVTDSVSACETTTPPTGCIPRFQPGRRTSWHYVLSAHAVGQPKWKLQDDSLESVRQSGTTVTFTTATAVGTLDQVVNPEGGFSPDPSCPYGRVTILGAASNPNLNGTFCLKSAANSRGTTFTITVGGTATIGNYTYNTDPNLAVAPGYSSSASGVSDVGGADSLITLGLWGNPALNGAPMASPVSDGQSEPVLAGTFMHELGHSIGLTHGGYTYPLAALGDYVPSLEPNCKPNFQSVMNYAFQVDLLSNGVSNVPDYSGQVLASLNEAKAGAAGVLTGASYLTTYWYSPFKGVGNPVTIHCDGSANTNGAEMALSTGLTSALSWAADQDINFDGNTTETLQGYNDWANIDLRQIGATGTNSTAEGGGQNFGGGGQNFGGGGQNFGGGGQNFGGGGQNFGGGGQNFGGGGQNFAGGGQNFGGGGEVNVAVANSVTRPPQGLAASEGAAPRAITLTWTAPTFGQIGQYNVYRAVTGGSFAVVGSVTGNPPALNYTDTTAACNAAGYEYFVTAVLSSSSSNPGQESVGSNTVTTGSNGTTGQGLLTGCYTNTPPKVALNSLTITTSSVVQGTAVPITWSLQDDYNTTSAYVNHLQTNSLVAIGPFPNNQGCPTSFPGGGTSTTLLTNGTPQLGASTFAVSAGPNYQFTFNLDTTTLSAGCYWFTLTLDSGQTETTTSSLAVQIYVSTTMPHITTTTLSAGIVGQAYSNPIYESGGVGSVGWTSTGSLPSGMTLGEGVGNNGSLSGTTCVAGNYGFTAIATDSKGNTGKQALTLVINQATTSTSVVPTLNASTYGQAVTFTATVAPQYSCVPTGMVTFFDGATQISNAIALTPGTNLSTASFTTSATQLVAGTHSITAVYSGDSNFYKTNSGGSTATVLSQVVNQASTTTSVTSSLNASTYGQSVIFSATVAPQYFGTPTGSVTFFDGATPISNAITLTAGTNLSTASYTTTVVQLTATTHSITAVYTTGDSNFYKTGSGGSTATALSQVVDPATLTAAVNGSQTYGGTSVMFSYALSGFVGNQNSSVLTSTALVCTSNAANNSPVGNNTNNYVYVVQACSGLTAPNYIFSYAGGAFLVNPAPLTITAASSDKPYDGTTSSTATPTASGLLFTDSVTGLAETYDTPNTGTGKTMTVSAYTVNDGNNGANYTVTTVTATSGEIDTAYSSDPLLTDFTNPLTTYATFLANADLTSDMPLPYTASAAILASGDRVYPNTEGGTIVVQFPTAVSAIRVFPNIDHLGSYFDGYQYSISGSNDGSTWVPLFDATGVSNAGEPFTLVSFTGTAPNVVNNVLTNAGSTGQGTGGVGPGGTVGYEADFVFGQAYVYYSFGPSTVATASGNTDQELSGVAALPPPVVSDVTKVAKK